jgi:hypothetical protein
LSDEEDDMSDPSQDKPADAPAAAVDATPPADGDPAPAPAPAPAAEAAPPVEAAAAPTEASVPPAVAVEEPAHEPPKEEPPKKEGHGKRESHHKKEAHAAKQPEPEPEPAPAPSPPRAVAPSSAKGKLLLVAWSGSPAGGWADGLRQAGYDVYVEGGARSSAFQWASAHQPVAAVIDLSTMPEDGQRLASTLRITAATAGIPVVFSQASGGGSHPAELDDVLARLSRL